MSEVNFNLKLDLEDAMYFLSFLKDSCEVMRENAETEMNTIENELKISKIERIHNSLLECITKQVSLQEIDAFIQEAEDRESE